MLARPQAPLAALTACVLIATAGLIHGQPSPPNVLFVTIDTVRADRIGAYGYSKGSTPTLDRLAREGVRFADATAQAPLTGPAHAALLTGMYPGRFGIRDNATTPMPAAATTMAELFKARGYRTGAFVGAFILDAQYGFAQGIDDFDASFGGFSGGQKLQARRPGGEVAKAAAAWLAANTARPFFAWVHLYDAHAPYDAPASFKARFKTSPYDAAVAFVDASIGTLVAALERDGRFDSTIVAVVADHGEGLGDHDELEHGLFLYDSVLHVPWIVRLPARQQAGTVVTGQVRAIDVLPTIAELAGVPSPAGLDGQSVVPDMRGRAPHDPPPSFAETYYGKLHFGFSDLKSVRVGDWKYIDAPRSELYQVSRDPIERQNVVHVRGTLAAGLAAEGAKIETSFGAAARAHAPQPDAETLARLRSLGYVGVTAQSSGARGLDPKDGIARLEAFRAGMSAATRALQRGDPAAAIPMLKRLMEGNDRSYDLHLALGDAYLGRKQYRSAVDEYTAASLLNPLSAEPLVAAARAHLGAGDVAHAAEAITHAERLEPGTSDVALVAGMLAERQGDGAEAMAQFEAAIRANRSDPQPRLRLAVLALRSNVLDKAQEQFTTLLQMGYRPSRMHFGRGQVAEARGDLKQAESEYRAALQLEPTLADAKAALAKLTAAAPASRPK